EAAAGPRVGGLRGGGRAVGPRWAEVVEVTFFVALDAWVSLPFLRALAGAREAAWRVLLEAAWRVLPEAALRVLPEAALRVLLREVPVRSPEPLLPSRSPPLRARLPSSLGSCSPTLAVVFFFPVPVREREAGAGRAVAEEVEVRRSPRTGAAGEVSWGSRARGVREEPGRGSRLMGVERLGARLDEKAEEAVGRFRGGNRTATDRAGGCPQRRTSRELLMAGAAASVRTARGHALGCSGASRTRQTPGFDPVLQHAARMFAAGVAPRADAPPAALRAGATRRHPRGHGAFACAT